MALHVIVRRGARLALALVLAAATFAVAARWQPPMARAATTPVSTVYKTATDTSTGSTAASADAPGGALTRPAHPGDTIKWVASYQNNTSQNASVNMTDPLTSAGAYVPGSLQLPADPIGGQSISPQYSADGGATWQAGPSPAGASGVGLSGTSPRARAGSASTSPPRRASRSPLPPATGTPWPSAGYVADSRW